jgi:peptide/nickel transport system ATP-binding protein
MLRADQLRFRYAPNRPWILRDVSLEVAPDEVVGLRGDSGLGKTTLAKILAGYLRPTTGRVTVDGIPVPERGCCPVQLVFQHPEMAVDPRWRIRDILTEGHDPPKEMLKALSIEGGWLDRWPHELSGGELQRIAVARALNPATRYMIADEITSMLDANTQAQLWQVVLEHARRHGMGILAISHHQALLERLCHRVIWLQQPGTSVEAGEAGG